MVISVREMIVSMIIPRLMLMGREVVNLLKFVIGVISALRLPVVRNLTKNVNPVLWTVTMV
jgi:hypothetical protein